MIYMCIKEKAQTLSFIRKYSKLLREEMETMFLQLCSNRTELSAGEHVIQRKQRRKRIKKMKDRKTSPEPRIMGRKLRGKKKRVSSESEEKNTLKALSKQFFSVLGNSF